VSKRLQFSFGKLVFGERPFFRCQAFFKALGGGRLIPGKEFFHPDVKPRFAVLPAIRFRVRDAAAVKRSASDRLPRRYAATLDAQLPGAFLD
jgi:hypothetical protein